MKGKREKICTCHYFVVILQPQNESKQAYGRKDVR